MNRFALLVLVVLASTAAAADRKPVLTVYGDADHRNCQAFTRAWNTRPEFRAALQAKYDVRFPTTVPPSIRCVPTFCVEGTGPLCGFRSCDTLLLELGIDPPAESRPDATAAAAELNDVKGSINQAMAAVVENRDELAKIRKETKSAIDKTDALQIEGTARWQRFEELRDEHTRAKTENATRDRRIDELHRKSSVGDRSPTGPPVSQQPGGPPVNVRPSTPPAATGADGSSKREWIWTLFGVAIPALQGAGILATGGVGGIALWALPMIFKAIARRRAAKRPPTTFPPSPGVEPRPPATRIVPDTRYTPVEVDRYAAAYAWARQKLGERYPGSIETAEVLDGYIRQHLSGQHVTR